MMPRGAGVATVAYMFSAASRAYEPPESTCIPHRRAARAAKMPAPRTPMARKRGFRESAGFSVEAAAVAAAEGPLREASGSEDDTPTDSMERTPFFTEA